MIIVNQMACSEQFSAALLALEQGSAVRRASWPENMELRKIDDRISVIRDGVLSSPNWQGPSSDEIEATDWVLV